MGAALKVSPNWSQETMTCLSSIGDFFSEQLLHDPVLQAGLAKPKGLLGGWSPFSLKTLRLTEPLNLKSLNSARPSQIW